MCFLFGSSSCHGLCAFCLAAAAAMAREEKKRHLLLLLLFVINASVTDKNQQQRATYTETEATVFFREFTLPFHLIDGRARFYYYY